METKKEGSRLIDALPSYPTSEDVWPIILKNEIRNAIDLGDNLHLDIRRANGDLRRDWHPHLA